MFLLWKIIIVFGNERLCINNKVNKLLNKNIKDIDKLIINDEESFIEIKVSKIRKSIYSVITNDTEISVNYRGYKEDKRIIKGW